MRFLAVVAVALFSVPIASCTKDPDLDPQPTKPSSSSSQLPHNRPVTGQGGGAFGALPSQQLRR